MIKTRKILSIALSAVVSVSALFAAPVQTVPITFVDCNGNPFTIDVPNDIAKIVNEQKGLINQKIKENGVTSTQAQDAAQKVKDAYDSGLAGLETTTPFTTVENGLNTFTENLNYVLPNSQSQQNVWAQAWIGKLIPGFHLGAGLNAGAAEMDVTPLKDAALALGIEEAGDVPDKLAMPTVTGDLRIGGFILPFDIGFNFCSVDSTKFGEDFESKIDPVAFDFYTIGADLRYALVQGGGFVPRWSIGVGGYYTKGNVSVANSTAKASLDFETTTIYASTQASVKFLCLIPFVGGRVMASRSTAGWNATANWSEILDDGPFLQQALEIGLLPESFGGQETVDFRDNIIPQVYAGIGLDLLIINITASASYDFKNSIPGAAVSVRLAW